MAFQLSFSPWTRTAWVRSSSSCFVHGFPTPLSFMCPPPPAASPRVKISLVAPARCALRTMRIDRVSYEKEKGGPVLRFLHASPHQPPGHSLRNIPYLDSLFTLATMSLVQGYSSDEDDAPVVHSDDAFGLSSLPAAKKPRTEEPSSSSLSVVAAPHVLSEVDQF